MNRLLELMDKYEAMFGDTFPTMCFQLDSQEEMINKISSCLKAQKTAEELFDLDYSNEY